MMIHRAPGLKREELAANAGAVVGAKVATFRQMYVNVASGFIVSVFEAASPAEVEEQMEILGFPVDEIHEIHFAASREEMEKIAAGSGGS
jgi:hypothetical protein